MFWDIHDMYEASCYSSENESKLVKKFQFHQKLHILLLIAGGGGGGLDREGA